MSIQFGRLTFAGAPVAAEYVARVNVLLAPYGPDGSEQYSGQGAAIVYRAFHTTKESHREKQPYVTGSGAVITWDGRLDNRQELIKKIGEDLTSSATDVEIVSAAYRHAGYSAGFLRSLIGDWALSIFDPLDRSLILARDPIGTRPLFYCIDRSRITWCTLLEPLVLSEGKTFGLCEEYIAGWFSHFPAPHLTPYRGIDAVPPATYISVQSRQCNARRYWDFCAERKVRYRTDGEYEEHFRELFSTAVERRLRSDRPVLAELSGGMDSSSLVCMADRVIEGNRSAFPRLDTVSWYADGEPDLDERPYFSIVEEKRGRIGFHIDLSLLDSEGCSEFEFAVERFSVTPIPTNLHAELFREYEKCIKAGGHRVVLSGIGGNEVTGGGIPSPIPELQDLLREADFTSFNRQLAAWSAKMRMARLSLLWNLVRETSAGLLGIKQSDIEHGAWFHSAFVRRNRRAFAAYPNRLKLGGSLPSVQGRVNQLEFCRRFVSFCDLKLHLSREVRFPFLDRELLEFMCAIPHEQVVRVGRRRSLMKRALADVVPDAILNRKRKIVSQPGSVFATPEWFNPGEAEADMLSETLGFVNSTRFRQALQQAQHRNGGPPYLLVKTIALESWLRHLINWGILDAPRPRERHRFSWFLEKSGDRTSRHTQGFS